MTKKQDWGWGKRRKNTVKFNNLKKKSSSKPSDDLWIFHVVVIFLLQIQFSIDLRNKIAEVSFFCQDISQEILVKIYIMEAKDICSMPKAHRQLCLLGESFEVITSKLYLQGMVHLLFIQSVQRTRSTIIGKPGVAGKKNFLHNSQLYFFSLTDKI